jgi:radical SAM superfamily enzyme YgiQ (UPF0313 family)
MKDLKMYRRDKEAVYVISQLGWQFHHLGVPTDQKMKGERYIPHLKMYVSGFETSPFGVEWMRFEKDCPLPVLVKTVPHPAFRVPVMDDVLRDMDVDVIVPPNSPTDNIRVAMIIHNGCPVELMEFPD